MVGNNSGLAKKSRYADQKTAVGVLVEILNSAEGKAGLVWLDANPGQQCWLSGAKAIAIKGTWYGYAPAEAAKRKIVTAAINMRSHGDALFISSTYPEQLQALPAPIVVS